MRGAPNFAARKERAGAGGVGGGKGGGVAQVWRGEGRGRAGASYGERGAKPAPPRPASRRKRPGPGPIGGVRPPRLRTEGGDDDHASRAHRGTAGRVARLLDPSRARGRRGRAQSSHRSTEATRRLRRGASQRRREVTMCKVLNARQVGKHLTPDRVYVGRPSKWGNPFVIGRDGSRDEVIPKYRAWIARQPALMTALHELHGKDLVCWRSPERCHAEVLIELANR